VTDYKNPPVPTQLPLFPPMAFEQYRRYAPSAYDNSYSIYEKMTHIIEHLNAMGELTNALLNKWNEFIAWIVGNGLQDAVNLKLDQMVANGTLAELINEKMLGDLIKECREALTELHNYSYEMLPFTLNYQKIMHTTPTTLEGRADFIQGAAFNNKKNEYYVARQLNGGEYTTITRYSMITRTEIDSKEFQHSTGAYTEGLPFFYNDRGELCFFVRTTYDMNIAIFNYDTGELGSNRGMLGGSKLGSDIDNKYLITHFGDANRCEGLYLYDFDEATRGNMRLYRKIYFDGEIVNGDKVQGVTMINNVIYLGRGKQNPTVTAINMSGRTIATYDFDRKDFADMINQWAPCIEGTSYEYESEGVSFYEYGGKVYPIFTHVISSLGKVFFALGGRMDFKKMSTKTYTTDITTGVKWIDLPLSSGVTPYADDVKPQYCKDDRGWVELRGVASHTYLGSEPNMELASIAFPFIPQRNQFFTTVASVNKDVAGSTNRIQVRSSGKIILDASSGNPTAPKQFTSFDGIRFFVDDRTF